MNIKDSSLYAVFDTVINYEKRCSYYHDSLYFSVSDSRFNEITFESGLDKSKGLSLGTYGYMIYRNHLFFIRIHDENLFIKMDQTEKFLYDLTYEGMIDDSRTLKKEHLA